MHFYYHQGDYLQVEMQNRTQIVDYIQISEKEIIYPHQDVLFQYEIGE